MKAASKAAKLRAKQTDTESAADIAKAMSTALRKKTQELRRQRYERDGVEVLKPANEDTPTPIQSEARVMLQPTDVDNPLYSRDHDGEKTNPRKITAMVNVRESSIEYLYSRSMIDDCQRMAGGKFRMYWEAAGGKGAKAIDYGKEHVDGGSALTPISDTMAIAGQELKMCRNILGIRGFDLMEKVAGQGLMIADLSKARSERDAFMFMLKDGLDLLAHAWGYRTKVAKVRR